MLLLSLGLACCARERADAQLGPASIGVNFIGGITPDPASEVTGTAGFVPQDFWNNVAPAGPGEVEDVFDFIGSTQGMSLVDSTGASTSLVVAWQAEESYRAGAPSTSNSDDQLMDGYIDVDDSASRSTITLTSIPYVAYDLYVYVGSDGNGRQAFLDSDNRIAGDAISPEATAIWFVTSTGGDSFTGPADEDDLAGNSPGELWDVVLAETDAVVEGFLWGSSNVSSETQFDLGAIYDPAFGEDASLRFAYSLTNGLTSAGTVAFFASEPGPASPDFDGDGTVAGSDFLAWQRGFGNFAGATTPQGDANGDARVDGSDFALWEGSFGGPPLASPVATAVPEPAGLAAVLLVGICLAAGRRSGQHP